MSDTERNARSTNPPRRENRRAGIPKKTSNANAAPPPPRNNFFSGKARAPRVEGVVFTVNVAVAADPLMVTDAGILQVGGSFGLLMEVETEQERFT